jgi:hypothetical protein
MQNHEDTTGCGVEDYGCHDHDEEGCRRGCGEGQDSLITTALQTLEKDMVLFDTLSDPSCLCLRLRVSVRLLSPLDEWTSSLRRKIDFVIFPKHSCWVAGVGNKNIEIERYMEGN